MPQAKSKPEASVSVIGSQLFQPLADLIGHMVARPYQKSDQVSSNYYEGGYSTAIILDLAVAVESMVARDRYFNRRAHGHEGLPVPEYMRKVHRYRYYVRLSELFVLRDAIVHNHVLETLLCLSATGRPKACFCIARELEWEWPSQEKA